jgi:hypothetical protein
VLGDALRLVRERLTEAESVGEVDYCGKRDGRSRMNQQSVSGAVRRADLELLFDHADLRASNVPACDGDL